MPVHLQDFLNMPNARISVQLKKEAKDKIKYKIKDRIGLLSKEFNITPARLYEYFLWQKSEIPLETLYLVASRFNLHKDIEKDVIYYKQLHVPSKISIKNPKLPIEITPYFTSFIANLFFDGSVPEDGKGTYYNQKNEDIMDDFINKVKIIFGDTSYTIRKDHRGVLNCRLPRLIGEMSKYIYQVKDFGTFKARIPEQIFNLSIEHKQAFVLTGLIDEGSISFDGSIIFGVSNFEMLCDFRKLCQDIGLNTTEVKNKKNSNHYYIYIKSKEELLKIIELINSQYPLINLRFKEKRLIDAIKIAKSVKPSDNLEKDILLELDKRCSVNYLSLKFIVNPRTIRYNLYKLIKKNKVRRERIGNEFIYFLN